jgi:hypothetical protein
MLRVRLHRTITGIAYKAWQGKRLENYYDSCPHYWTTSSSHHSSSSASAFAKFAKVLAIVVAAVVALGILFGLVRWRYLRGELSQLES